MHTFLALSLLYPPFPVFAERQVKESELRSIIGSRSNVGFSLYDLDSNRLLLEIGSDQPMKPASTLKLVTTAAALKTLRPQHTFRTEFWGQGVHGSEVDTLVVKGFGDPDFKIEDAWIVARKLKLQGIRKVKKLAVDSSSFLDERVRSGQRAFQTAPSALAFNFNSISFEACPAKVGSPASVHVDPWEMLVQFRGAIRTAARSGGISIEELPEGSQRLAYQLSGSIGVKDGCRTVYRSVAEPERYFGITFLGLLKLVGISVDSFVGESIPGAGATLLYTHESKSLALIIGDMNHFSNNFIAEQLVYALGDDQSGAEPKHFSHPQGVKKLVAVLRELGVDPTSLNVVDGSGLSHDNRINARTLITVIQAMMGDPALRPEFESSLSVGGVSGTLKQRDFDGKGIVVRAKTGTIDGVRSLAGYLVSRKGARLAFALIQNNVRSRDEAITFEDRVVEALYDFS